MKDNVILIGMPGAGKSTIGVVLAKSLGMRFVDSDLVIQELEDRLLQDIINKEGMDRFLDYEEHAILTIKCKKSIVATGGSVVYRKGAMDHLRSLGKVVYLDVSYKEIERRVNNITTRGIAIREGATLRDIYEERTAYYQKYKDMTVDCDGKTVEDIVDEIVLYSRVENRLLVGQLEVEI